MSKPWITFFSQTGSEIVEISKSLNRWPDVIITNERPTRLRSINTELLEKDCLITVSNKPTEEEIYDILKLYDSPVITLHGWLRIMPPSICNEYKIYNGHPGLITKYPELRGKDPQLKAHLGNYDIGGSVIHEITPELDEGPILLFREVSLKNLNLDDTFRILSEASLDLWIKFFEEITWLKE